MTKKEELFDILFDLFEKHARNLDLPEEKRALANYYVFVVREGFAADNLEQFKKTLE